LFNYALIHSPYSLGPSETKFEVSLSDGTKFNYALNEIVSKTKMPDSTQFKLYLDNNRYYNESDSRVQETNISLHPINDSTFLYFDEVEIEVPKSLRKMFDLILEGKTATIGTFIFIDDKRIKLIHL